MSLRWLVPALVAIVGCGSASARRDELPADLRPDAGGPDLGPAREASISDGLTSIDVPPQDVGALLVDPKTCEEAALGRSYIGCEYWPTITPNAVWSIFDYAVVVANAGDFEANVTVTGPNGVTRTVKVEAGSLAKIYLPWVKELKGPDGGEGSEPMPNCTNIPMPAEQPSVTMKKGAYHLVSSRPVTVYQFNALEYKPAGGPPGKDWSSCPGYQYCSMFLGPAGCFSYSNDASLLLPVTALTGTYRITGLPGFTGPTGRATTGAYFVVTGTQDDTIVTVKVGSKGKVIGGGDVSSMTAGGFFTFRLNAGDVAQVKGEPRTEFDLSGSLVTADKPIQVIAGNPCIYNPVGEPACDHIEESVLPAETLGRRYVVTAPNGPDGRVVGHVVRLYGNVDGTSLSYDPMPPPGAPTTINAGEVFDLGVVDKDFVITGSNELAVSTFMLAGKLVDPDTIEKDRRGDPSQSAITAVEQYRKKYVFLAPDDYDVSYVVIASPPGATITLDGAPLDAVETKFGGEGFAVRRAKLGPGKQGAHVLVSTQPVGMQVLGYGKYTSYQYPAGLDLARIAPPPPK